MVTRTNKKPGASGRDPTAGYPVEIWAIVDATLIGLEHDLQHVLLAGVAIREFTNGSISSGSLG